MNNNIEELYKQKYLKYKAKYLNLQRGGVFTQGRNHPEHYALSGALVSSIDVGGSAGFMALDNKGNIAVVTNVNEVKIINLQNGVVVKTYTVQSSVNCIAFDSNNLYIGNIFWIDYYGYPNDMHSRLNVGGCSMLACNSGYIYILAEKNIYVYTKSSSSSPQQILQIENQDIFFNPVSIAFDRAGNIVVADVGNNCIQVITKKITPDPTKKDQVISLEPTDFRSIGSFGKLPGQFYKPTDFAFNLFGQIIVADSVNNRVQILNYDDGIPISFYTVKELKGIVVDGNGRILVSTGNTIQELELKDFVLFPAPKPYFILTSNIKYYLDYLKKYDPNIRVDPKQPPTLVSSYAIIFIFKKLDEQQINQLIDILKERFEKFTIEMDHQTKNIKISSTNIPLTTENLESFKSELPNELKDIFYNNETIYKHTVMTTAEEALRYRLTEDLRLSQHDAVKQENIQATLDENKLQKLEIEPPLPR
jgi:hypothetical protein